MEKKNVDVNYHPAFVRASGDAHYALFVSVQTCPSSIKDDLIKIATEFSMLLNKVYKKLDK